MLVVKTVEEMKRIIRSEREKGHSVSLVPTMGALHEGHFSLFREARSRSDLFVASIFVNPTQFGKGEDFSTYPRDDGNDLKESERRGVDVVFNPSVEEMYPEGFDTFVEADRGSHLLCGRFRPGHFRGVLTVVLKLFTIVNPHLAFFGEKDYQQLMLIKRMVKDLHLDVEIVGIPIVRDEDGLAISSRNRYLSSEERRSALLLNRALFAAREMASQGERDAKKLIEKGLSYLNQDSNIIVEYVSVVHPETLNDLAVIEDAAVMALAARVGKARLIDNVKIVVEQEV